MCFWFQLRFNRSAQPSDCLHSRELCLRASAGLPLTGRLCGLRATRPAQRSHGHQTNQRSKRRTHIALPCSVWLSGAAQKGPTKRSATAGSKVCRARRGHTYATDHHKQLRIWMKNHRGALHTVEEPAGLQLDLTVPAGPCACLSARGARGCLLVIGARRGLANDRKPLRGFAHD